MDMEDEMNETDIRQRDIDSGAVMLLNGFPQWTPQQWRDAASNTRCAEIAEARRELSSTPC